MTSSPGGTTRTPSTWGRAADRGRCRFAFSLIEVLLVLALLAAVSALVLPQFSGRLNAAEFTESAEQVRSFLHVARAEAQRLGSAVDVTWDAQSRRLTAVRHEVSAVGDVGAFVAVESDEPETDGAAAFESAGAERPIREHTLAAEIRLRPLDVAEVEDDALFSEESFSAPSAEEMMAAPGGEVSEALTLCTYLNDGSALYARPLLLDDGGERRVVLRIDEWTGLVSVEDAPRPEGEFADGDDLEAEEPPEASSGEEP